MLLYHFTPAHLLHGCLSFGIIRGCIPFRLEDNGRLMVRPGYQWLTVNSSWQQSWNVRQAVRYDRAAFRIALKVPKSARRHLYRWIYVCKELAPHTWQELNGEYDPENWYVYQGRIRPIWIRRVDARPALL